MKNIISNKKIMLTLFSIVFVVICMIGTSYAVFFKTNTIDSNAFTTGVLEITASSVDNAISLDNAMPMSDSDGANQDPYTFTITNTGDFTYTFDVMFLSTTLANAIDSQYIKVMLDSDTPVLLSSLTNGILKSDVVLKPGQSITFNLRIWLSLTTSNTQIGKTFTGKITTNGEATEYVASLAEHIIELAETNADQIRTISHEAITTDTATGNTIPAVTDYRYYGADENADGNPDPINNYIYYNCTNSSDTNTCETWRIVGVFYDELTDTNRVKIVSNNKLANDIAWDTGGIRATNGVNAWSGIVRATSALSNATLNTYLNDNYYVNQLSQSAKNIVSEATWYLGGDSSKMLAASFYTSERKNKTYNTANPTGDAYTRATYWDGIVGLLYPSDYGYAAANDCLTATNLFDYKTCNNSNWLYDSNYAQWLLSSYYGQTNYVFVVDSTGDIFSILANSSSGVRPVLYLKYDVGFAGGNGSQETPFVIKY